MKKLLKSGICRFVNNAQMRAKKVKRENTEEAKRGRDKLDPNRALIELSGFHFMKSRQLELSSIRTMNF